MRTPLSYYLYEPRRTNEENTGRSVGAFHPENVIAQKSHNGTHIIVIKVITMILKPANHFHKYQRIEVASLSNI